MCKLNAGDPRDCRAHITFTCAFLILGAAERSFARGPVGPIEAAALPAAITHLTFLPKSADRVSVPRVNSIELENARGVGKA